MIPNPILECDMLANTCASIRRVCTKGLMSKILLVSDSSDDGVKRIVRGGASIGVRE